MATYNQQPAYQTYNFRPYELPTNELFNSIQARSAFWVEGAQQVRNAYEQAANLELSHRSSKDKLKNFMVEADKLIGQAGKTDLSIAENRKAGVDIFKPLYNDRSIMLDDQLTRYYKSQFQIANNAKTQNGGKDYSATNEAYMMEKFNDFVEDGNEANWENHYNSRRGYTPYYNYRSEFDDVLKNCKPDTVEGNSIDGLYFINSREKVLSSTKLSGCLQSGLSDRAKNQLKIEGYMGYGKNYQAVAQRYMDYSANELDSYAKKRGAIDGQLQALRDKEKSKPLSESEKVQKQSLEQSLQGVDGYINDQQKNRQAIASGNLKYIQDNYEGLAGTLHLSDKVNEFSNYYAYSEQEKKFEENNAAMLMYKEHNDAEQFKAKFDQERQLEEMRQQNRLEIARIRSQGKLGAGRQVVGPNGQIMILPDYPLVDPNSNMATETITQSEKEINDKYVAAGQLKNEADNYIYNEFKTVFPNKVNAGQLINSEEFANYMKTNPDDIRIKRWLQASDPANKEITRLEAIKQTVDENVRKNNPSLFDQSNLSSIPSVFLGKNREVALTPQRMQAAFIGSDPEFRFVAAKPRFIQGAMAVTNAVPENRLFYRGVDITDRAGVQQLREKVNGQIRENLNKIKDLREKEFSTQRLMNENLRSIGQDNIDKNPSSVAVRARVGSALGIPVNKVENNVFLVASDLKGKVYVDIQGEDVPEDVQDKLEFLKAKKISETRYELNNVPEYSYFSGNSFQDSQLSDIDAKIKVNTAKINRGDPVEIPISLKGSASSVPDYKIVVKKGIRPGQLFYDLSVKNGEGVFVKLPTNIEIAEPADALQIIEQLEKQPR